MHGGKALVEIFRRAGVDYVFSSPGTEWPPVWEALAEARERGESRPTYINCRHEAAAVAAASGYTKVTGRPQAVLLHATAGPLNAAMFLRAAYQERVPMVVCCGESSAFGEEKRLPDPGNQWVHDLTDVGGPAELLRRCVKWSERIASSSILIASIERALEIAVEPPAGPVLLGLPFECLLDEVALPEYRRARRVTRPAELDERALDEAARLLLNAQSPVAVTEHAGRDAAAVAPFVELCEALAMPVMESFRPAFLNFPRTHPLYLAYDARRVASADLVLVADAVTPWYPLEKGPRADAKVLFLGDEYPYSRLPFWGYAVDLALVAPPAVTLSALARRVKQTEAHAANRAAWEERAREIREEHERQAAAARSDAAAHRADVPIDPRWLCQALAESIPAEAIVLEETTVHRTLIQSTLPRSEPMSYLARVTGGLGVSLGYGVGAKLARPEKPVFVLIGDGGFHYNPVPACLGLAQEYELPVIVVVFNNQRYLSMERGLLRYYPDGAAKRSSVHFGGPIAPNPDYRLYAEIYGGYGVRVTDPGQIHAAVARALEESARGRLSVIDVVLNDYTPRG
ncbi:MAG TPA: thiamine pyrophosphate-binding protein [candidate division Zixibacteria bacterium]|nr:thiamine pyrophosphate-binding protein [candidate division Zixibacteria bacterium]